MKQIFKLFILIFLNHLNANAQIPNPGFELGYNNDSTIKHWLNNSAIVVTMPLDSILIDGPLISLSSITNTGLYALELRNSFNVTQNWGQFGNVFSNKDSNFVGFAQYDNFEIIGKPTSLSFYYLHIQNPYVDTLQCKVFIYNSNKFKIGEGVINVWEVGINPWTISGFHYETIEIKYLADSLITIGDSIPASSKIKISNIYNSTAPPHVGQRVLIDDFSFSYTPLNIAPIINEDYKYSIYPNPTSDKIFINGLQNDKYKAEIYAMDGRLISTEKLNNNFITVPNLKPGNYMLKITSSDNKSTMMKFTRE